MNTQGKTQQLSVPSLTDVLYQAVREQIFAGSIVAGEAVTEAEIAERYSVARPTAKAALERLVHDGLLRRSINKSARVPILDVEDIRDLYWTRSFIEREMAGALALRREVPDSAIRYIQDLRSHTDAPDLSAVVEADIGFHRALLNALGSARLTKMYDSLMGEVHLCMAQIQAEHLNHPAAIADEHVAIVDAIGSGDPAQAVEAVKQHLEGACERLVSAHLSRR